MTAEVNNDVENPWVCPNDRQLALRSRLGTGWSYRSFRSANRNQNDSSISDEEMKSIYRVITKAEQINYTEQERICRMVDRLENMRSGIMGDGHKNCLLCGKILSKLKSVVCQGCRKRVCVKCSMDTRNSRNKVVSLCKLCNEQRELWKRTGAWFFQGIPNLAPPIPFDSRSEGSRTPTFTRHGWARISDKSADIFESGAKTGDESFYDSSSLSEDLLDEDEDVDMEVEREENFTPEGGQMLGDDFRVNDNIDQTDNISTLSTSGELSYVSAHEGTDKEFETYSIPSRESFHLDTDHSRKHSSEDGLGVLEFTLKYDEMDRRLDICIHSGKDLKAMDVTGTSDPYVKLHLLPGVNKATKLKTKTQYKTLNPVFEETLTYYGIGQNDLEIKTLRLQVYDEDRFARNDFIGEVFVRLDSLKQQPVQTLKEHLLPKRELDRQLSGPESSDRGRIQLSLKYVSSKKTLVIGVIRCAGLAPMDSNGYSDPFVKCYLKPDPGKKSKRRTSIKKRTLNPEFNEEFRYEIAHNELAKRTLEITVWDYDVGKRNDFIGGIIMGVQASGDVLKHWFETLKTANKSHTYWHPLQQMIPPVDD